MQKINRSVKRGSYTFVSILLVLTMLLSSTAFAVSTFDLSALGATADSAPAGAEEEAVSDDAEADIADSDAEADIAEVGTDADIADTDAAVADSKAELVQTGAAAENAPIGDDETPTDYTITVNTSYSAAVSADEYKQTVEIYNVTTAPAVASGTNEVSYTMPGANTTPTLNLKSSNKVCVSSVVVKDASGTDITDSAFGVEQYYTDFIESCKTSLFGYVELQGITGNITVEVAYDEAVTDLGYWNNSTSYPYCSVTIVTKGDVGPYDKAYLNDYPYQDVAINSSYGSFDFVNKTRVGSSNSNNIYQSISKYPMRDGGQITRYREDGGRVYLDKSNYSYIDSVEVYINDDPDHAYTPDSENIDSYLPNFSKIKGYTVAHDAYFNDSSRSQKINNVPNPFYGKSITVVVTYKEIQKTVIYAKMDAMQYYGTGRTIRMRTDETGRFTYYYNSYVYENQPDSYTGEALDIYENDNPFTSTGSGPYNDKIALINSDTVTFYFDNEQGNSIDFRNVKVYALDVDGNTYGEPIAGEGVENPKVTLEVTPATRTKWSDDGRITISGLKEYGGNIFVDADVYRYNHKISLKSSGEHTASFTISAKDDLGQISGAGTTGDAANMRESYTKPGDEGVTEHWVYSDADYADYIIKSSGEQELLRAEFSYTPWKLNTGTGRKYTYGTITTETYYPDDTNGEIIFRYPTNEYYNQNGILTVYFKAIDTYEAQMWPVSNGGLITNGTYESRDLFEVSTYENGAAAKDIYNTASGATSAYESYTFKSYPGYDANTYTYKIAPGATVKVRDVFVGDTKDINANTHPQSLQNFINRRLELKDIEVYPVKGEVDHSSGYLTKTQVGDKLSVTKEGDYYVFTMPDKPVRIQPIYQDHIRKINILANDKDSSGKNYRIDKSQLGTATLKSEDKTAWFATTYYAANNFFYNGYQITNVNSDTDGNFRTAWANTHCATLDDSTFTLTATPKDKDTYTVAAVKAYAYQETNSSDYQKYNYLTGSNNFTADSYNWLTFDEEGNANLTEIEGVVGALSAPASDGSRTCTITIPDAAKLTKGNIILYVDFEKKQTTKSANFEYVYDDTAQAFNPIASFTGTFDGTYKGYSSVSVNKGGTVEAAVYDDVNAVYTNLVLGNDKYMDSAFYNYNLEYTLTDYTTGDTLLTFRLYHDTIIPTGKYQDEDVSKYIAADALTVEDVADSYNPYICERVTVPFKLTENGFKLTYHATALYIPVTVKQWIKDSSGNVTPANDDFKATLTKYAESGSTASDRYFSTTQLTDPLTGDSYPLLSAADSAFCDSYITTGASETRFMLIENSDDKWHGFTLNPTVPKGYKLLSSKAETVETFNMKGDTSPTYWGAFFTTEQDNYIDGVGYYVKYHPETGQNDQHHHLTHMGGQHVVVNLYYEVTDDYYAPLKFVTDNENSAFKPRVTMDGEFSGASGTQTVTDGASLSAAVYNGKSTDPKTVKVTVGGDKTAASAFYHTNLVYTLTSADGETVYGKFRIFQDKLIPISDEEQLGKYIDLDSFKAVKVDGTYDTCETVTFDLRVPEGGLTITSAPLPTYIPVEIKQEIVDDAGNTRPVDDESLAVHIKERLYNVSDQNLLPEYFITDSIPGGDYYAYITGDNAQYTKEFDAKDDSTIVYMLVPEINRQYPGFFPTRTDVDGYSVIDFVDSSVKAYNASGEEITDAKYRSGLHYKESDKLVEYGTEGASGNSPFIRSAKVVFTAQYKEDNSDYLGFRWERGDGYQPKTILKGGFRGELNSADQIIRSEDVTNKNYTTRIRKATAGDTTFTATLGGGTGNESAFYNTNLVYTLYEYSNGTKGKELMKFRVYQDKLIPIGDYTAAQLAEYVRIKTSFASVENTEDVCESVELEFTVPDEGLCVSYAPETPYLPITVKQYILNKDGTKTAAGESFTADIARYGGSGDLANHKFFTNVAVEDSYGLNSAIQDDFTDKYTVTGASDSRYMLYQYTNSSGVIVKPDIPANYTLAAIEGKALNKNDDVLNSHSQGFDLRSYSNGYQVYYTGSGNGSLRGAKELEVDIYYQPATTITVKQAMGGTLASGTNLAIVTLNNTGSLEAPYKAYINSGDSNVAPTFVDKVTLTDTKSNVDEVDADYPGALVRTNVISTNKGVKPEIVIEPKGARNVTSVTISKKVEGEYVALTADVDYTVDGSGDVNGKLTYTLKDGVAIGDDYLVEIIYGNQQNFTVKAVMLDERGNKVEVDSKELYRQTAATITVTGERYNTDGSESTEKAFHQTAEDEGFNKFIVTYPAKKVISQTNTKVTVETKIGNILDENNNPILDENGNPTPSPYVIANVVAFNDDNRDIGLVKPGTKTYEATDGKHNGGTGTTYETCTLDSLTSQDNVTVVVYLAKVAKLKVSVFNVMDDGKTIANGVPNGLGSDAYVNVNVASNGINTKAIITKEEEGGYYTGDIDITYDPHSREVSILQGSKLNVFAQLPGNGDYVVKKILTNSKGYENITVSNVSMVNGNLRETLNTNTVSITGGGDYELNIYIEKAKTIHTRVVRTVDNTESGASGTVYISGTNSEEGVIPFTKINPVSGLQAANSYEGSGGRSDNDLTTEAKAIRNTKITFTVKPPKEYGIKSVTVKSGSSKEKATDVAFTASAPESDGTVTYTITDPEQMSYNYDLYIDVTYAILDSATIYIDWQYTKDYKTFKNVFDPDEGIATMRAYVNNGFYGTPRQLAEDLVANDTFLSKENITYKTEDLTTENKLYQFKVAAGNFFSVDTTGTYIDGDWYMTIQNEGYILDENTGKKDDTICSRDSGGQNLTVQAGHTYLLYMRLAPIASIDGKASDNNHYGNTPDPVLKDDGWNVTINATPPEPQTDFKYPVPRAMHNYPGGGFNNSYSYGYHGEIYKDSTINSVEVDYTSVVAPGKITKVVLYEFDKGVISDWAVVQRNQQIRDAVANPDNAGKFKAYEVDITSVFSYEAKDGDPFTNGDKIYRYKLQNGEGVKVQSDKSYRVYIEFDRITVYNSINGASYAHGYLFYQDPANHQLSDLVNLNGNVYTYDYDVLTGSNRYTEAIEQKKPVWYVIVADLPREDLQMTSATFRDYFDKAETISILDQMTSTYTPYTDPNTGITKYYYYYQINPDDDIPIDNTMRFSVYFYLRRDDPPVVETDKDCDIYVEQWNRDTYDGNYVRATNQKVQFSVPKDDTLIRGNKASNQAENPLTISEASGTMYSLIGTELTILPFPDTGYNVEKIEVTNYGTGTYRIENGQTVKITLRSPEVTIKVYYSRPLIRISSTNEGNEGKAEVDVYNTTTEENERILDVNTYTNGTFVTKGDNAKVIISPLTYHDDTDGKDYYYTVASIRIGDAFDNTLTAYTESGGDVADDAFTVTKSDDGSVYTLTLNDVQKDKYIFIQLVGKEKIYTSNLQVNQQIRLPGTTEYVDCSEGYFGTVTVNGALADVEKPLNIGGEDVNTYTFYDKATIEGTVRKDTTLSFSAIPPEGDFIIRETEVRMNGGKINTNYDADTEVYTLDTKAPDSGTTVITIRYSLNTTPYKLIYRYTGRRSDNTEGYYDGDDADSDEKTYVVERELYPAEMDGDKPTAKAIASYAPAVEDLYKDCKWVIDGSHVEYDTEHSTVTVTAEHTAHQYSVEFYYGDYTAEPFKVDRVELNSLVKPDGKFIEAPETHGGNAFAYWSVTEKGTEKEIARCYNRAFNLRVTGNIVVTATYKTDVNLVSISDPVFTREQTTDADGNNISDTLYADFILAYMEQNGLLLSEQGEKYQTGLIIEQNRKIRLNKANEEGATVSAEERDTAIAQYPVNSELTDDKVQEMLTDSGFNGLVSSGDTRYIFYSVDNSTYNNRNRVNQTLAVANSAAYRQLVMRAYYYVYNTETGEVELSKPVYFYFYDIGNSKSNVSANDSSAATPDEAAPAKEGE